MEGEVSDFLMFAGGIKSVDVCMEREGGGAK
jgi:hypothetical protein